MSTPPHQCFRRDGWTPARQLRFLDTLVRTRSVTRAAAVAGMSRESAYRLRRRPSSALFAAAWDRALEGHKPISRDPVRRRGVGGDIGAFPPKWAEGHEVHGPLGRPPPPRTL